MVKHSTTPGYIGGLVTGHIEPKRCPEIYCQRPITGDTVRCPHGRHCWLAQQDANGVIETSDEAQQARNEGAK